MEAFDGFIAAISSEFKIKFIKEPDGEAYTADIEFENGRTQKILITLSKDESGDRIIHYYSVIAKLKHDSMELFKYSLEVNSSLDYGAIALMDGTLLAKRLDSSASLRAAKIHEIVNIYCRKSRRTRRDTYKKLRRQIGRRISIKLKNSIGSINIPAI